MFKTAISKSDFFSELQNKLEKPFENFEKDLNKQALQNLINAWNVTKTEPKLEKQAKILHELIQIKLANKEPTDENLYEWFPELNEDIIEI
jgi:hypothetical protein